MNLGHKIAVLFILMFSILACKENPKEEKTENSNVDQSVPEEKRNNLSSNFSLTLSALIQKDDEFQLFFIQENTEGYSVDQMISQKVIGSDQFQDVIFEIPAEYYPFNIRLDLGTNQTQSSIQIKECILHYGNGKYVIPGNELKNYFVINEGIEILPDSTTFKLKTFKEGDTNKYDPFMMGNLKLNDVLLKKL